MLVMYGVPQWYRLWETVAAVDNTAEVRTLGWSGQGGLCTAGWPHSRLRLARVMNHELLQTRLLVSIFWRWQTG
jgi:hypothetical protein